MTVTSLDRATEPPLRRMVAQTPTDCWNDSCATAELEHAVARGATGATSNPTIALEVLEKELERWIPRVHQLAHDDPSWSEVEPTGATVRTLRGFIRPYHDLVAATRDVMLPDPDVRAGAR